MAQYIKKDALVAEIEKLKKRFMKQDDEFSDGYHYALKLLLSFLNTLEVKEVDLEKEFDKCCENYIFDDECEVYTAKHFFKLGFKAGKGE